MNKTPSQFSDHQNKRSNFTSINLKLLRKNLNLTLNVILILLTVSVAILGIFTYRDLDQITEKLQKEAKPNINFILYKDLILHISQLEDLVNTYRLNHNNAEISHFELETDTTIQLVEEIKQLHPVDYTHVLLSDSLQNLVILYHNTLQQLSKIERTQVKNAISDLESDMESITPSNQATKETSKKKLLNKLFSSKKKNIPSDSITIQVKSVIEDFKKTALTEAEAAKRKELAYLEDVNNFQIALLELLDFMEDREITKSKINTINAQELISKTKYQITIFSLLATVLLLITLIMLFIFTSRNKQYNEVLQKAKKDAEELAKSKEHFLANMSHEIRTPINAIIGFTNQLGKSALDQTQKEQVNIIDTASKHLLSVLNDILDFTKLQNAKLQLDKEPFLINETVSNVCQLLKAKAEENGNEIILKQENTERIIVGDPYRLKQIILNLTGNSIKFTQNGKIEIIQEFIEYSKNGSLKLTIKDNGIGIPEESQKKIFKEFEQGKNSKNSKGTGLGLSIVKKIVDLHKGTITLKSKENEGTAITIELPYKLDHKKEQPKTINKNTAPDIHRDFSNLSILIADDEVFNLKLLEAILKTKVNFLAQAENGKEAKELLMSNKFDIALLDIKMPYLTGWEVVEQIRNEAGINQNTPCIALTATVAEEAQSKGLKKGFNKVMRKPFDENELLENIYRLTSSEKKHSTSESIQSNKSSEKRSVKLFDTSNLNALGDESFVNDMLTTFISTSTENMRLLNLAYAENKLNDISGFAHKTVAPARHLNATQLVSTLKEMEKEADNGQIPKKEKLAMANEIHNELISQIEAHLKQ